MDRKKLLKRLIYLIFFILIVNFLANKFYWYSAIWWFDMPMHFWGGFWLGLAYFYVFPSKIFNLRSIVLLLLFVLCIGIGWEVFEIAVNDILTRNPFDYLDTFSDIFFDLAGGAGSVLYFFKRIMLQSKNTNGKNS